MDTIKDKTAIVGIGWTKFGSVKRPLPESQYTLACRAIKAAIDDAGLTLKDIDGIMRFSFGSNDPVRLADSLGLNLRFFGKSMYGGGGGCACVAQAAAAVHAGLANYVVAFRALSQSGTPDSPSTTESMITGGASKPTPLAKKPAASTTRPRIDFATSSDVKVTLGTSGTR